MKSTVAIFLVALWSTYMTVYECAANNAIPCKWKSLAGATYDLQPLEVSDSKKSSYLIVDGDIPCTKATEPTYSFLWNFCADITPASFTNDICAGKTGAAIQYLDRADGYQECEVIGHFDPEREDTEFSLLNNQDPSKGVTLKYLYGDRCPSNVLRSTTINVHCANVHAVTMSALEPEKCQYVVEMQSMYGCPKECPITSNGLCNSHGHCHYDPTMKAPYCYCNEGYSGSDCQRSSSSSGGGNSPAYNAELSILIILMISLVVLVGFVVYTLYRVTAFRKEQADLEYSSVHDDLYSTEMVDHTF
jgi:hypothetical protein